MKKDLFLLLAFVVPALASAQLKVNQSGEVGIKNSTNFNAKLNIGDSSYSSFNSDFGNYSKGIWSYNHESGTSIGSVAVLAEGLKNGNTGNSIGIWGNGIGLSGKKYGVIGTIKYNASGAAIYGSNVESIAIETSALHA